MYKITIKYYDFRVGTTINEIYEAYGLIEAIEMARRSCDYKICVLATSYVDIEALVKEIAN